MLYIYGRMLVVFNLPQYISGINEKAQYSAVSDHI